MLHWPIKNIYYTKRERKLVTHVWVQDIYLFTWLTFSQKGYNRHSRLFLKTSKFVVYSGVDQFH